MVLGFFAAGLSAVALRHFSPSVFHSTASAGPGRQQLEASRAHLVLVNEELFRAKREARPVYPYSVVSGGVEDARELKWVAEHDPIVAAHYAGFDYEHARVVRLVLARTAYVSYRIGNHVYWTRRRITLHKGEKVITDGKITARARCANRVEDLPQQATSSLEPPVARFEVPLQLVAPPLVEDHPVSFASVLLGHAEMADLEPTLAFLSLYGSLMGARVVSFAPRALAEGAVCGPGKKGKEREAVASSNSKKKKGGPCSNGAVVVPETGTWLFCVSGLAAMYWQVRRNFVRT